MAADPLPPASSPVTIVLADGRALFRASLARLLADQPGLSVLAQVADAADLLRCVTRIAPAVAVLDLALPGGALDAAGAIRTRCPQTEVVLYGIPQDDTVFIQALEAGAKGFADGGVSADELSTSIRRVAAGEVMVSPSLARHIAVAYGALMAQKQTARRAVGTELTERELGILRLVASGCSNRQAAAALGVSEHTVRAHLRSISRKLKVQNRVQAVSEAIRTGLIAGDIVPSVVQPETPEAESGQRSGPFISSSQDRLAADVP